MNLAAQPELDQALRKFQKELSAGTVALVLLSVVGRAERPIYGYEIARRLEAGAGALANKQSALYPVLRNLDAAGYLESEVEPSVAGPPRRYYRITPLGREVLAAWIATWTATRDAVDTLIEEPKP